MNDKQKSCRTHLRTWAVSEAEQSANDANGARIFHLLPRRIVVSEVAEGASNVLKDEVVRARLEHGYEGTDAAALAQAVATLGACAKHAHRGGSELNDVHRVLRHQN
jgi:hypothetical protein